MYMVFLIHAKLNICSGLSNVYSSNPDQQKMDVGKFTFFIYVTVVNLIRDKTMADN